MRRTRLVGALAALLVLSVLLVPEGRPPRAQTAPAPATGAARMVFLGESGGVVALSAADATVLFEVADPAGVRAVAADEPRGRVWAYSPGTLRAYRLDGTTAVTVALPTPPGYTSTTPVSLVVHPEDGSAWLSVGPSLQHLDAQGTVLLTLTFGSPIRVLALDPPRARIWVGTATSLAAYSDAGQVVASVALGGSTLLDAEVEPGSGHVFAALDSALRRYDLTGAIVLNTLLPLSSQRWIANDGAGGVWAAATPSVLARVTGTGQLAVFQSPWAGPGPIVGLVADPTDQTAWVGSPGAVTHVGPTGTFLHQLTLWAALTVRDLAFLRDLVAPEIRFTAPLDGAVLNTSTPRIDLSYSDLGAGVDPATLQLTADGQALAVSCTPPAASATCTPTAALADGAHTLAATVKDKAGNLSPPTQVQVTIDTVAPAVTLSAPAEGLLTNQAAQTVTGSVSEAASVILRLNGAAVQTLALSPTHTFTSSPVTLAEGQNLLEVVALDAAGNAGAASRTVTLDTIPPAVIAASALSLGPITAGQVTVSGAAGSAEPGARVTLTNLRTGASVTVTAAADGSFSGTLAAQAGDRIAITVADGAGNASPATTVEAGLPSDPAAVAPAVDRTVATALASATSFLYTGANPIQTGVAAGTIDARRAAVLRGQVKTRDGAALPGVTITVLNHPEFGQTLSRADGLFDLAVNGGGVLTVQYAKDGFLPAQRQIQAPWQDYAWLPEVVLLPLDAQVTAVTANATTMQVARGNAVTDADGTRQATVLFPAGTTATLVFPNGATQSLSTLSVRATEYTVGANGSKAMPAELPPTSGYTYAVELSVDEALAAGATSVRFNQPVVQHVENFVGVPVGTRVPTASYDRAKAAWAPVPDGRVVQLLAVTGGLADLDVTGSGTAADAAALAALGVTDAERARLATLYTTGQRLWRVPIPHFSAYDSNWGIGCQRSATVACLYAASTLQQSDPEPKPTTACSSIIECQNQLLGESLPVTGSPWRLAYRSDRTPGWLVANTVSLPLSGPTLPAGVKRIDVEFAVAGQVVRQTFAALPGQTASVTWNGLDAYGRTLNGRQRLTARLGYVYPAAYMAPAEIAASFGYNGGGTITGSRSPMEITLWQVLETAVGSWDAPAQGLGGWTLDVHHAYDPVGRVLYLGDGTRREATSTNRVITTVAGTGTAGYSGDGGPGARAQLSTPGQVVAGPDGSLYVVDWGNHRIRRLAPDGIITTLAGTGVAGSGGDGGPATQAQLDRPTRVALGPDGSLYITDFGNHRVRRVAPDGLIATVAGTGTAGSGGDGGPATQAQLNGPDGLAVASDGTLYIAEYFGHRIRRVAPDGLIRTVAGTGAAGSSGDGGPATQAQLSQPAGVALGPDGSLYISDELNHRLRRVTPDGAILTVAGTGVAGYSGDEGPATQAQLNHPVTEVAFGPEGSLYLADWFNHRLRRIWPDGHISTLVGTGVAGYSGDGGPANLAQISQASGATVAPDGSLYFGDNGNHRIRRVAPALPGVADADIVIPAEDGGEIYVFDRTGRHLRTVDSQTNAVLARFRYDAAGRLTGIEDRVGLVTTIERDAAGLAAAIVAPGGQRTALGMGADGLLASVTNPAGEATRMTYSADGLLATFTDPKGQVSRFTYDALGRLTRDADAAGGALALARTGTETSYTVTRTTSEGRATTYQVEPLGTGGVRRTDTDPSGIRTQLERRLDGRWTWTAGDGTVTTVTQTPDPRFRMAAPLPGSVTVRLPSGLTRTETTSRTVSLANPDDPLSLQAQTDTTSLNGRAFTRVFDAAAKTLIDRTPAGRQLVRTLDALGRLAQMQAAGLEPVSFTYDLRGRLTTITEGTGVAARVTSLSYDLFDRLVSVADPLNRTVGFAYDLADRVTTQTLPDGRQIGLMYDPNGNVTSITPPRRPAHGFGYTPVNLEASYTPPALDLTSPTTTVAYNTDRQPTLITRPDGQTISFGYDAGGRLSTLTVPTGIFRYAYSATTGQLTTLTAPDGGTLAYTYDGALVTSETWGGQAGAVTGRMNWTYDNDFRIMSESVNGANAVAFGYDPDSLLTQAGALSLTHDPQTGFLTGTTLGSLTDTRRYSTFGELASYQATVGTTPLLATQYTRDSLGRITQKAETLGGATDTFAYAYDLAGRLTEVQKNGVVLASYAYDANSNRTSRTTTGGTVTGSYDAQDRLLAYGDTTYTYTANGELAAKTTPAGTTTYQYDVVGNLLAVTLPDGMQIDYVIDGRNRCIGKKGERGARPWFPLPQRPEACGRIGWHWYGRLLSHIPSAAATWRLRVGFAPGPFPASIAGVSGAAASAAIDEIVKNFR